MDSVSQPEPSTSNEEAYPPEPSETPRGPSRRGPSRNLWWLDLLVFAALAAVACVGFYRHAGGDFYSDEADYALASVHGFEANRWDRSDTPREPDRLIAARHFHAPLTVDLILAAHCFGASDRTIRMPFILLGGLLVGWVYLCGLALFDRRREIAVACAVLVAISPPIVRMASHALPWSPIILELLIVLWCMAEYTRNRHWGWIAGCGAALAALFLTSEIFFVAAPAVAAASIPVLWRDLRGLLRNDPQARRRLAIGIGAALALSLALVLLVWPSGPAGESIKMLRHYIRMSHSESFPVNIGIRVYGTAPKWAYLYWYWNDYKPFFVCYAVGVPGVIGIALARKLHLSLVPLLSLTAFLMVTAHGAHIIGPEYLADCLPFLTLFGGFAIYGVSLLWRPLAVVAIAVMAIPVAHWSPRIYLPGMDPRAQRSRWPAAARSLAAEWKPGDKIVVGSQPVNVAHWYLVYQAGVPPLDSQFQTLPVHSPKKDFLERLASGFYRYVAVSNMVEDSVDLDPRARHILAAWNVRWRSDEGGAGASRLIVYERPRRFPEAALNPAVSRP